MNSNLTVIFIYNLLASGINIWIQDNVIQLFVPDGSYFTEEQKNYIKLHKEEILNCLHNNKVYSKSSSLLILKHTVEEQLLSFAQERLWFIEKYEEGTNAYNIPMIFKLSNDIKLDILEESVRSIVTRHEILRTLIKENSEGNGYQVVINDQEHPLEIIKVNMTNHLQLDQELKKQINHVYDLTKEYPIKVCICLLRDSTTLEVEYYLGIVIHHIAFDGWSIDLFLKELQEYYHYYLTQSQGLVTNLNLADLSVQYKDFALWQRNYLRGERLAKQLEYWKNKLSDYEPLNLISDKPRPSQISYQGSDIYFELDEDTSERLRELAKELKVSLYSVLLSGYYLMLRSYSNQDDIVVGTPVANRHYNQIENLIGFFVNSLALRIKIDSKELIKEFIQKVGDEVITAQLHQDLPFEKLVEELKVAKDTSRHPIFQVMFAVQRFGNKLCNKAETNLLQEYATESNLYNVAKFDISIFIDDSEITLKGGFNYAVSLYTEATISRFIETYIGILKQLAELAYDKQRQDTVSIAELNYLPVEQYQQIAYDWNNNDRDYPNDNTIHQLFEEQVERTPDNIAVIYEETRLTYKELNERTNQLANYLKHDIKPDTLVALCLDRSEYMLIAILAILKVGGAYVPIDPSYPNDRVKYILTDTSTKLILTNEIHKPRLEEISKQQKVLAIDSKELQKQLSLQLVNNPNIVIRSTDLAYVIYTSGTTGNPKGIMIEHRGVINLKYDMTNKYQLRDTLERGEVILLFANYVFDASVEQIVISLLNGYVLVLSPNQLWLDNNKFYYYLNVNKVTHIHSTPKFLEQYNLNKVKSLRRIITGGEALTDNSYSKIISNSSCDIINSYGPTEVSITSIINIVGNNNIAVGKPIANIKCYVLDSNLMLLPIGGIGELYIGGIGLARGYLNRPDLTAEKFIANPFQAEEEKVHNKNTRLYKTGDLVRWLPDGNLEYLGRNDFQVKIRGYRIELGEIESILASYDGVKQSVVIAKKYKNTEEGLTGNQYLVGYYVSESKLNEEDIINYLQKKLPEYMIPSVLVHLEKLPLTLNGKLDRKALPEPEFSRGANYVAPRNEVEKQVCEIWANVLGLAIDKVGIRDDFFRLGGNSIVAIRLVSQLNKKLNSDIALSSIFKYRTIQELVHYLKYSTEDKVIIDKAIITNVEEQLLSFAQERLWFIEKYEEGTNAYNIPMIFKLSNDVKLDILEKSVRSIVTRHEILRTLIKENSEGNGYQVVINDQEHPLEITNINVLDYLQLDQELEKQINHVYNLTQEYPIRVCLYILNDNIKSKVEYYLSIVIHHIAFDGWSVDIFLRELQEYYNYYSDKSQGLVTNLNVPDLSIQYKDFALWQRNYLSGERLAKQLEYWKNKLSDYEPLNLISDKPRPSQISYQGSDIYFELDEDTSERLRELAKELKVSLYSVLLSGYYLMLRSYSNQDDIVVGIPVANRHYNQIENLFGFFVNSLALRIKIDSKTLIKEFIQKVGGEVIAAQLHQDLPFEKLVEELKVAKDTSRHPIFQVMFAVQRFGAELYNKAETSLLQEYITESSLYNIAKFDISTFIDDSEAVLKGSFNYAVNLYTEATISRFIETYIGVLRQLAEIAHDKQRQDTIKVAELNCLDLAQYQQIIYDWNDTDRDYPGNKTIHQLFEEQVERTPDNIAIIYEETKLTYKELNERANQLAYYLRDKGVKQETIVAICLERSLELVIGLLGILKSGGTYLAIDPRSPIERLKFMLEDTKSPILLTTQKILKLLPWLQETEIYGNLKPINIFLWENIAAVIKDYNRFNPINITHCSNVAYLIYTSGSTGEPKGISGTHYGTTNRLAWSWQSFPFNSNEVCCQKSSLNFVDHIAELFSPLLQGVPIILLSSNVVNELNISQMIEEISVNHISRIVVVPAMLKVILQQPSSKLLKLQCLKYVSCSGEVLDVSLAKNLHKVLSWVTLINVYGSSEVSADVTYYQDIVSNSVLSLANTIVRIGKPIVNIKCYVLDSNLVPLPIGGIGELYIGGIGLARGYLNRPDFTAEKFIANPFQAEEEKVHNKNTRLYKTGDLVRWLPDGNLEYLGRNDFQVKIRGYRIELGEIESILASYDGVKQSVVIAKEHKNIEESLTGNQYLVGYYVSESKLDAEDIISYLQEKLPEYMIPSVLVHLKELPLTINGKLDRKALPEPEFSRGDNYVAPRNEVEKQVCEIWANVLGLAIDKVGIRDDFFRLGGNSIVAIRLVSQLNKKLNSDIALSSIFKHRTIQELVHYLKYSTEDKVIINKAITTDVEEQLLSFAQERLWFIEKYEEGTNAYNIPIIFKLSNDVKLDILEKSVRSIVTRHEILRTLIKENSEGNGYQVVINDQEHPLEITNINVLDYLQLDQELEKQINHVYDLTQEYPIRVCIYSLENSTKLKVEYYLSIVIHHIAFDGWSIDIFSRELQEYYNYYSGKSQGLVTNLNVPDLSIQYKDFALWQRNYLSGERLAKQLEYWKNKLSDYEPLNLISDKPRPSQISYQGSDIYFELDEDTSERLRELAKELKVSLYSVLLSGYYLMLRSYSNQDDIVVGTPVANRHYNQIENLIGFFVNSLALRIKIDLKTLIKEFIQKVGGEVIAAQLHQDLPFEKLVEELKVAKDTSRHPIFQVMFLVQGFNIRSYNKNRNSIEQDLTNLLQEYMTETTSYKVARFDISTFIDDSEAVLKGSFNYAVNLYTETTINRFVKTYVQILKQLAEIAHDKQRQDTIKVAELNYLNLEQYQQIVYDWNDTDRDYPSNKTIHQLFEEQVERTPDNIAIIYAETKLTYRELNERANRLANYLVQYYNIKPDTLVALCLDRSEYMLIAMLAILKVGGAYVPIDPSYPNDRVKHILTDASTKLILTNEIHKPRLEEISKQQKVLAVDSRKLQKQLLLQSTNNQNIIIKNTDLAYVIYTSGTTGNPKGVMIEHRSVINYISNIKAYNLILPEDKVDFSTNAGFDLTVTTTICALCAGSQIVIYKDELQDLESYKRYLSRTSVNVAKLVPSYFELLIDYLPSTKINKIILGGEKLSVNIINKLRDLYNNQNFILTIWDEYGPTEATVGTCNSKICLDDNLTIGKPYSNYRIFILDDNLVPLPIGGIGELYIGGIGLARGYLNRPDLTAEKFIANPFQAEEEKVHNKNTRLYKTGDLVRWLPDGNLEYIGRNDFQVKIRGYRIELGEIENTLASYDGIGQSVVIAKEHKNIEESLTGNQYLVGYYVSESKLNEEDIINYLQKKLPEYMIPSVLVHLEELPLTINGKLDRKALPEPEFNRGDNYVAPRNEVEKQVCEIWANVLGLTMDKVGICDDFFRLGGNSIVAIRLVSQLNKKLNSDIALSSIFKHRTIQELVHYLKYSTEDKVIINKAITTDVEEQLLSFAQERLWFIEKYEEGTNAYNIPIIFKLSNDVKLDILEKSVRSIVTRHEILRTLIKENSEGNGYQVVINDQEHPLEITNINVLDYLQLDQELEKQINHVYDLTQEYPIRVCIYSLENSTKLKVEYYLSIVIHHIAFDGWSIDIFSRELQEYYNYYSGKSQGLVTNLNVPDLSIQYKDFALWQRNYLSGERLAKQLEYWKNKLSDYEPLNLISDKPRPSQISYQGSDIYFELDEDTSERLRELAKELKVSLYSVLLSGYYLMLRSYSNQDDIVVGTPVANRHYNQIENLIGFFVNSLALRVKIDSKELIKEFIQKVGDEVVSAQLHQDLPFEKLVEELKVAKDTSRHPIFQIMFAVQRFGAELYNKAETSLLQEYITESSLYNIAKFDISTFIDDSEAVLKGSFNYTVNLYTEATISRFIETYIGVLRQLAEITHDKQRQDAIKVAELNCLDLEQYQQIIYDWNNTDIDYPGNKTIHQLFEEQVERTPDNVAIIYEETKLTYRELNEKANHLANYLVQYYNIKPDTLVALCLDRSEYMLIAMLAILKVGGAYVSIDPSYPNDRVKYILTDASTKLILTNEIHKPRLEEISKQQEVLVIDSRKLQKQLLLQSTNNQNIIIKNTDLAYVIYTSGTTGNPKGVMIEHRSVINYISNIKAYNLILPEDKVDFSTNAGFDLTVTTTICALCAGSQIVIYKDELQDLESYKRYLSRTSVNVAKLVPSYFELLIDYLPSTKINKIILGGEKLSVNIINKLRDLYNNQNFILTIWDEYGPTEATVGTCNSKICLDDNLTIGKPYSNYRIFILDDNLVPLPIGGIGELYIGGIGLARGYLNRPDLTAEKFIANPFQAEEEKVHNKNTRLYKTGDLVRWLSDGNLEYIGRNDFQVKIRGYRIELGEIENTLASYDGIGQSVVIAKEHKNIEESLAGNQYLVGYYVSESKLDEEDVISYLQEKLPEYMIPSVLVHLKELPLTINGKLDRKALPEPEFSRRDNYVAPRNEVEKQVCEIWANVLGLTMDKVGICDDFFRLGGDSIVSIQLISRLRQKLNLNVSIKDIFVYKTIERIYDNVLSHNNTILNSKTEQGILKGKVELLPIQLWFFESNFVKANHWNQSFIIRTPSLDLERLEKSVHKLVEHHDGFRLLYKKNASSVYTQYYYDSVKVEELKTLNIETLEEKEDSEQCKAKLQEILTNWQSEFNLEYGSLYSIGYIYGYADGSTRIFFALHHLIVDAVSWRILVEDLRNIYNGKELGPKGSSYRQWVETVKEYAAVHSEEEDYWNNVLADYNANIVAELVVNENINNYTNFELSIEQTQQLLRDSNRAYHTQVNDILLTALGYALHEVTGSKVNHIILEGHGREEIDSNIDVTRTIGWFTTMYPVRLEMYEELGDSIKNTKENLRQIPNRGIGYGAIMGYKLDNMPRITFNYLGQFDEENNLKQQKLWSIVDENSGNSVHSFNHNHRLVDINGLVIGGKIKFSVASKLYKDKNIRIAELFKQNLEYVINHAVDQTRSYLTISDVESLISQECLDKLQKTKEIEGIYLANNLQQGFIYHALNQGNNDDAYIVQLIWQYENKIEVNNLKKAWCYAQMKYQSLRLRFGWEEELVQVIDKIGNLDWRYIDLSREVKEESQEQEIGRIQGKDRLETYKLDNGSLFRVYLIKQREDLYTCIFSNHHAILDGWSTPILLGYIHETYLKLQNKEAVSVSIDYSYGDAQKYLWRHKDANNVYWDSYVSKIEERSNLSFLLSSTNKHIILSEYKHIKEPKEITLSIQDRLYYGLKKLNQEEGITLNTILQYVWHKVLSIYGRNNQTIVGTIISGRDIPIDNIENSVGLYINTLPLIVDHRKQDNIIELLRGIQNNINEINSRSNVNLAKLQKRGERLFDSLFIYENYPSSNNTKQQDEILKVKFKDGKEKLDYPLGVVAYETSNQLIFKLEYAGELFCDSSIKILLLTVKELLEQIANNSQLKVQYLNYLPVKQYQQIIYDWNDTDRDYPGNKTIHQLFEEQVERTPDNVAIIYAETKLTYRELNERANRLANYLVQYYNIKPDTLVALCLDRSEYMLIAMLAILKVGGAYVPIDPSYPNDRVKYILTDTSTKLILTNEIHKPRLEEISKQQKVLAVDSRKLQKQLLLQSTNNQNIIIKNTDLAYVIYTSGTTGNPKGVMIEHRSVINYISNIKAYNLILPEDKVDFSTNAGFDLTVTTTICALCAGSQIVIYKDELQDLESYKRYLSRTSVNVAKLVPSYFELLIDYLPSTKINKIILGGEKLSVNIINKLRDLYNNQNFILTIWDEYGPTEATVGTCNSKICLDDNLTIGKPYSNYRIFILDDNLVPLPIGGIGELYIGGIGLARGYLNRPDLTAEKFIANPFQAEEEKVHNKNTRLYKTGDLVRWLPDGNLEYIGRNDFQVKIRGYRIELGEIENTLASYDGIGQSVVIAKEHKNIEESLTGNQYLVGYYVSESKLNEEDIINYLQKKLPEYMIPSVLVHLEELPLTINGKLDRKALPEPEFSRRDNYVAPRNEVEKQVCEIWANVLGLAIDKVGIRDDFFRLGGNSIVAIRLVSQLNKKLNSDIALSSIFKHRTIQELVHYLKYSTEDKVIINKAITTDVEEQLLSFAQERLWFIEKYEEGTNAYNIPMIFKLSNDVKLDILEKSVRSIVTRHEILRTLIKENSEGNGYQVVINDQEHPLEITNINVLDYLQLDQELEKQINHVYDLTQEYPIRVCLYILNDNIKSKVEYYLSIVIHHIVFDGWSVDIFLRELQEYYNYYSDKSQGLVTNLNVPDLSIQYKDFALWQRNYLSGERLAKQLEYWKNKLSDYEPLNLISDKPRPSQISYQGSDIYFELDEDTSERLRELAKELKVSLYSVLLSGYYLMLRSYSNQDDIVVGTPVANRHYNQIENLIGFFVNSLALRIKIDSKTLIKEFIQKVGGEVIAAQLHQDLPFEKLVEELKVVKDTSKHPIFQVMFEIHGFNTQVKGTTENNLKNLLKEYITENSLYNIAKFDISTFINDSEAVLKGSINYAVNLYTEATINRFVKTYVQILKQLAEIAYDKQRQDTIKVAELNYLNLEQYQQIVYDWNDTDRDYPSNKTIHQLFEEQVERTPDNIAIIYEETKLTYRELNERANQLANYLKHDIKPDTLVALCLDRSEYMLIAILAVLKVGGAYVPIDPSYPDDRVKYILADTGTELILTNEVHKSRLEEISKQQIEILAVDSGKVQKQLSLQLVNNPNVKVKSTDLAYIIYTSGTTGNSKGVMTEHRGVINLKHDMTNKLRVMGHEVILLFANYVFDTSVEQIILSLLNGHILLLIPNQLWLDKEVFYHYLGTNNVTHMEISPKFLEQCDLSKISSLKRVIAGGEALTEISYNKIALSNSYEIINSYGPTEVSITSIINIIRNNNIAIGKPIANISCYVLNNNLMPLPIGGIGELYIGGVGLARGYLNRPDLTAEKFIANPFQTEEEKVHNKNTRLYKTGDLVRWLPDGNLEYIGRNDFQVKIRGYRIELGEIENTLASYDGIGQSVVIAKEHKNIEESLAGNQYLVGYYVSESKLDAEDIISYLQEKLPEYMIPSVLVHLKELPLTINGKLDRKALPEPEFSRRDNYVAPRNEVEKQVCEIWANVLGLTMDKVGICDDFFRLGGDSIVSIQLISRLRQKLNLNVSIKDIFVYKTIERIYDNVLSHNNTILNSKTEQGILKGKVELLPIQLWFFESNFVKANHWNQSFIIRTPSLDLERLEKSVHKLVEHHDGFRLLYKKNASSVYTQYYYDSVKVEELKTLNIETLEEKEDSEQCKAKLQEILTNWQSEFNLEYGSLYSIGYIYGYADGSTRIFFALHHLIVDAVSWRILVEDLRNIYNGKELGPKGSSYRQWVETVKEYAAVHSEEEDYWNNVLADYNANIVAELVVNENINNYTNFELSIEQTQQLLRDSNRAYHTQVNDILLTALGYALHEVTGSKVNHIILEGHGREEIDSNIDVTRTIGWFTTMYPVRLEMYEELGDSIKNTKENLRQIPNRGIGYGAIMGYKLDNMPRITFNYLGQFDEENNLKQQKLWSIVDENSGIPTNDSNQDYEIININGMIIGNKLKFNITSKLDLEVIVAMAALFKKKLEELIFYCMNKQVIEYTMSDFNDFEPYVLFNKKIKGNQNKLFIFPPGEGGAESYFNNIVPKLCNKHLVLYNNYYLYLSNKFSPDKTDYVSYENLAKDYICYIKSIQSQGPYNLFGWSFGGVLALEIAKQLVNGGNTVRKVVLIDSFFNYKKVILKTNTLPYNKHNINYKYSPSLNFKKSNINIILFKALRVPNNINNTEDLKESNYIIYKYYAENAQYNYLDYFLSSRSFALITMDDTHESWINNNLQIIKICNELLL